jgi:hypothetical protein
MGASVMFWTFETPLPSGDDTITSDGVEALQPSVSTGIYLVNLERFRIGISVSPEAFLFGEYTNEGFYNDYFSYVNTIQIAAEASILF